MTRHEPEPQHEVEVEVEVLIARTDAPRQTACRMGRSSTPGPKLRTFRTVCLGCAQLRAPMPKPNPANAALAGRLVQARQAAGFDTSDAGAVHLGMHPKIYATHKQGRPR